MNKLNSGETSEVKISCSLQALWGLLIDALKSRRSRNRDLVVVAVRNDTNRYQSAGQKILEENKE